MNLYAIISAIVMSIGAFISSSYPFMGTVIIVLGLIAMITSIATELYKNNKIGFYRFIKFIGMSLAFIAIFVAIDLFLQ